MQNQGYSRNNLHQGDVRITGDLQVDGEIKLNDLNVNTLTIGDPEYTLPTEKGNAGDLIIATGDGSTSEWQPAFQGTGRVWQNIYSMYEPRGFSSKTQWEAIDQFGYGNRSSIDPAVFPIGSSFKFTIKSQCEYTIFVNNDSAIIQMRLEIQGNFPAIFLDLWQWNVALNTNVTLGAIQTGAMDTTFYVTRTSATNLRINSLSVNAVDNGISTTSLGPVVKSLQNISLGSFPIDVPFSDTGNLTLSVTSKDLSGASASTVARLIPVVYTIDLCSNSTSILATSENLTTDHTLLSNLNLGDAGHTQFALLAGRSGGQVLSGGITPLHDLKLKSHTAGLDNIVVKDLNTEFKKNVDMNSNNIINAKDITNSSGNKIDMNTGGFLSTLELSSADEVKLLNTTNNNFITMSNAGTNITSLTGSLNINHALGGNTIDMYNTGLLNAITLISNTAGVYMEEKSSLNNLAVAAAGIVANSNSGNLTIRNTDVSGKIELVKTGGGLIELTSPSGVEAVVDSNVVKVNNGLYINGDKIIYVPDGTMPSSFSSNTTYIFCGSRSTATTINLATYDNITFKGESRETSSIEFTGVGVPFITTSDANFSLVDLKLKCNVPSSSLLVGSNALKDKILTIQNCEVRESYAFADITGYELVDVNNVIFIHLRGDGILTNQKCLYLNAVAKTNITSCEIVKFYEFGQPANTNPFDGAMIYFIGACGAININNCIIHPRVNQRGVEIEALATFLEFCLNSNAFINVGLTSGTILQTNSNASWNTNAISEANSLLPNLKSYVGAQLSALNTATTATSGTPADINLNNLLTQFSGFGVTVAPGGGVTYNRKRPVNFQVTFVANLQALTGGANQRVALTVSKNGVNTGINSFVTLDSSGTEPKSVTLTLVGNAVQGDVFRSQLVNLSTSSNVTCLDLIVSGIEI